MTTATKKPTKKKQAAASVVVTAEELLRARSILAPITKSPAKPILENVLLRATAERVELIANNLEQSACVTLEVYEPQADVTALVPADRLFGFAANYPDSTIAINVRDTSIEVTADGGKLTMPTANVADFPVRQHLGGSQVSLPASALVSAIRVAFAADAEDGRYALNGVAFISRDGGLYLCATNGRLLAMFRVADCQLDNVRAVMPVKAVAFLRNLEGDCRIVFGESAISVADSRVEFTTALLAGRYPDVFAITLVKTDGKASILREATMQAAKSVLLAFSPGEETNACDIRDDDCDALTLASATEAGKAASRVSCPVTGTIDITVNARYLLAIVGSFPGGADIAVRCHTDTAIRFESSELNYSVHLMGLARDGK